jgi:hypothetical protein
MTIALDGPVFCRQNVLFWLVLGAGQAGGRQCSFDLVVRPVNSPAANTATAVIPASPGR